MKKYKYDVKNLDCANCARKIQDKLSETDGYNNVVLNYSTLKLSFETDKQNPIDEVRNIVCKIEPETEILEENKNTNNDDAEKSGEVFEIIRLVIGVIIAAIGMFGKFQNEIIPTVLIIVAYVVLLFKTAKVALKKIFKNKTLDEDTLITISCIGAYLVGKHHEGLMVILLYEIGEFLESKAVGKSRKSIKNLMDIKPEYANLKIDGETKKVDPNDVKIGDIIVVKVGEKIPLDGVIIKGNTELNTSALTGESILQEVAEGQKVLSGSINEGSLIEIEVTEEYSNSTVNKILELVETATDRKAKTENFVSKAAKVYTPVVIIMATLVACILPLIIKDMSYSQSIYKALIFLVIACPCSIAISVPLSYFSGIGRSSRDGILIKGSDYLDILRKIKYIVFDKTGTITTGNFAVQKIESYGKISEEEIYKYFVLGESYSNHPLAKSILEYKNIDVDTTNVKELKEVSGKGIEYLIDDKHVKIGNKDYVGTKDIIKTNGTVLYLSINNEVQGYILLKDKVKPDVKEAIGKLKNYGIKTYMFTGDREDVAVEVAKEVNIDEYKSEMLPKDKYNELENIINGKKENSVVAFVGDGINDSPVIARSDIGISMGGLGAASSIEASDVVIMTDEISKIIDSIRISKKTNKIIKQNLIFAFGTKILILIFAILGISDMWEAVFADVGVTIITIFNTLRILK